MAKEATVYTTPVFRAAFLSVFQPKSMKGDDGKEGQPKYSVTAIFRPADFKGKDAERWKALFNALDLASKEKFKMGWKELPADTFKKGIRDGRAKADIDGFGEGTYFANLTTQFEPSICDINGNDISREEGNTDEVYSGCYMRAKVTVYAYANKGKGVALGLSTLQKVKDGPRLDARKSAGEDFKDEELDTSWLDQNEGSVDDDIPF